MLNEPAPPAPSFCNHGINRLRHVCGQCVRNLQRKQAAVAAIAARAGSPAAIEPCEHATRDVLGPAILICRECGDASVERIDERHHALELWWKMREFVRAVASSGDHSAASEEEDVQLRERARELDGELQTAAPRVAADPGAPSSTA